MLDVLGIFVSGAMMLYIIIRAVQLDVTRPWFEPLQHDADEPAVPPGQRGFRPAVPGVAAVRSGVASPGTTRR